MRKDLFFHIPDYHHLFCCSLTSNMEQGMEHKRLPCVLFLDLYLKRRLSVQKRENQPLVVVWICAAFLLSK